MTVALVMACILQLLFVQLVRLGGYLNLTHVQDVTGLTPYLVKKTLVGIAELRKSKCG